MKINIQSLEDELVEFDSELDNGFIDHDIKKYYINAIRTHVVLDKFGKDYRVDIEIDTEARYECDRCLEEFPNHFRAKQRQLFHVGSNEIADNEDIIQLPDSTTEIDLSPFLMEMVLLNHPIKMICKKDCKGLCPNCGANLNMEECRCSDEAIDPRWNELRKLIK
ncbi:MAG: DUF177 domain-containing protein [Calditrichaceae bacterium]